MPELAVTMPKMSMTMEEGTMVSWLKNVGDPVKESEPIAEVATDKVDMEVESPYEGTLARTVVEVNDVVKVGDPIAYIDSESDDLLGGLFDASADDSATDAADDSQPTGDDTADQPASEQDAAGQPGSSDWPAAVPAARALAVERGVDLATVTPTGPGGTIRVDDVEQAASGEAAVSASAPVRAATSEQEEAPSEPAASGRHEVPATEKEQASQPTDPQAKRRLRTRMQVAKVMTASAAVPQFTANTTLDLSGLERIRKTELGGASWTAVLVRAQALALREHPELSAFWSDDGPQPNDEIGVALAVDSPVGLLAPVVRGADAQSLSSVNDAVRDIAARARSGEITLDDMSGGTTVFSNLGGMGVDSFNAVLTPPHATALSAGAVAHTVVAPEPDVLATRLTCTVGLTVDHRVADGADAARLLQTLREIIASPKRLRGEA